MTEIKAVIVDYIGTLANARNYSLEISRVKLHRILTEAGFETSLTAFLAAYNKAHEKYRVIRLQKATGSNKRRLGLRSTEHA